MLLCRLFVRIISASESAPRHKSYIMRSAATSRSRWIMNRSFWGRADRKVKGSAQLPITPDWRAEIGHRWLRAPLIPVRYFKAISPRLRVTLTDRQMLPPRNAAFRIDPKSQTLSRYEGYLKLLCAFQQVWRLNSKGSEAFPVGD